MITDMRHGVVEDIVAQHIPRDAYAEAWDIDGMKNAAHGVLNIEPPLADWAKEEGIGDEEMRERLQKAADEGYAARVDKNGVELTRYIEKQIVLQALDHLWREHLVTLDHLRQVVGWRGVAQRDPLNEYKSEAFELFGQLITQLRETTTTQLSRVEIAFEPAESPPLQATSFEALQQPAGFAAVMEAAVADPEVNAAAVQPQRIVDAPSSRSARDPATWGKVGRNEACPCGSGKKYKHCHGAIG
jgi:preprotein translocase subunit SecA